MRKKRKSGDHHGEVNVLALFAVFLQFSLLSIVDLTGFGLPDLRLLFKFNTKILILFEFDFALLKIHTANT